MAVTITVDLGTSIVPVPLPDSAIAYTVYTEKGNDEKAVLALRFYTVDDVAKGFTPASLFEELKKEQPGIWLETYSNLSSLIDLLPADDRLKFAQIPLAYNTDSYSWEIASASLADVLNRIASRSAPSLSADMVTEFARATEELLKARKTK